METPEEKSDEIIEESVFSPSIFDDAMQWIKERESYILNAEISGTWVKTQKFFRGEGQLLKQWTGKTFENEIYLMLTGGQIGEDEILVGRRILHVTNPEGKEATIKEIHFNNLLLRNAFIQDTQDRIFFRAGEYDKTLSWLEIFLQKYTINCLVEGIFVSGNKAIRCTVSGAIKKNCRQRDFCGN